MHAIQNAVAGGDEDSAGLHSHQPTAGHWSVGFPVPGAVSFAFVVVV